MKVNLNKFKEHFSKIDKISSDFFQKSFLGKVIFEKILFRSKSFYSLVTFLTAIIISQLASFEYTDSLSIKINTYIENSQGLEQFLWRLVDFFLPTGNWYIILVIAIILLVIFGLRQIELKQDTIEDSLLKPLKEKTESLLFEIQTQIDYNGKSIEINRDNIVKNIEDELIKQQILILSGVGGVGKTAVIKKFYEKQKDTQTIYLFKASEFNISSINELFPKYNLQQFIAEYQNIDNKIMVIDSAEKLLDYLDNIEAFKEFLSTLIKNSWKIIFTTRESYLDDLNYQFIEVFKIQPFNINIKNLTKKELVTLSAKFDFKLPKDIKLTELLKNPFYLNEYLTFYQTDKEINYLEFKEKLWDKKIKKSDTNREKCFLNFAFKRANDGYFFVDDIECKSNSLKKLKQDGILGKETVGYFITHDIYEEWALEKIIKKEFIQRDDALAFFEKIGSSLPIRRSFRNWISEKLLLEDEDIKLFIEEIIDDNEIELFWKDEIFVSILLSDYSDTFFENFEKELLVNDYELLKRISFLLRLACKEADNSIFGQYKLDINIIDIFSLMNQPKGNGWKSFISFVHKHIDEIKLKNINTILPVLYDWNSKNKKGEATRLASLIVLKYYKWINQEQYKHSYDEHIQKICNVIIGGTTEIQKELEFILDEIIKNKWKDNRDNYYELSVMVLSTSEGLPRASLILKNMPEYVFKLADLFWSYTPRESQRGVFRGYEREEVETAFGLDKYGNPRYFPDSALQTPFYYFLKIHQNDTINFMIDFINECVEKYRKSDWEEVIEVEVNIDSQTKVKQYHSQALWNMYRGTSSPVMPDVLKSLHMALEKHILEVVKKSKQEDVETLLKYLLIKSKSSSITAIVASCVLANPDKTFNIAKIVFKTKEFIQADLVRQIKDYSEAKFLYGMGYGLNSNSKVYADERLKTCEDKHRESQLESLFLNYQMFRSEEVSEDEADNRQKELWNILDNYYEQLPPKDEQVATDKTWQMFLARMDKRKMDIQVKEVDKGFEIEFKGKLTPELEEYSKTSQKENSELMKYTSLFLWSKNRLEEKPLLALEQLQELIDTKPEERSPILQKEVFSDTAIVLLRDFSDLLKLEDKELCKDIILEFSSMPFQKHYNYQMSDGTDFAIAYLPILLDFFPDLKNDIKVVLLLHLFNDYPTDNAFYNYAIIAIHKYFNEEDIKSFLFTYLILKPKYDNEIEKIIKETGEQRFPMINKEEKFNNFIQENEATIEKMISNQISFDIEDISKLELYMLNVAFRMIPLESKDIEYKTIQKEIINTFSLNLFDIQRQNRHHSLKDKHYRIPYNIKQKFIEKLSDLVLQLKIDDIPLYLQPLIDNFKKKKVMAKFFTKLIYTQDRVKKYDNFWHIWELFENPIVKLCEDGEGHYSKEIVQAYLLANVIWDKNTKTWHTLKEKDKRFFKRMSKQIGHCPSTLYSISKLLTGIGSSYLNDGIGWISYMVKNNKNLLTDKLEPNTIFNLEIITRKYVLQNSQEIKKSKPKKEEILEVLNFLVEKGSAIGYMLRERIL